MVQPDGPNGLIANGIRILGALGYLGNSFKQKGSAMPTRIYLVRHGATQLTEEDRFAGSADVCLSEEGRKQVASLAERLKDERLDAIYSSPLARTLETARILATAHGVEPIPEPALREIDYGRWEKLRRIDVERDFHTEYEIWQEDPFTIAPEGGESGLNVIHRVLPVVRRIVEAHRHRSVLLVSHKGTNRLLVGSLLGFDLRSYRDRLDELLNGEIFYSLREAQIVIESWRRHYNAVRPHQSLGYKPPAPEVFIPAFAAWPLSRATPAPSPTQNLVEGGPMN